MEQEEERENAGISSDWSNERYVYRRAMWRTISPATQCGSRSWAEIIRFECTLAAAVGNSVISGHPAYNGYHNGIKHNASINVNNNRAAPGVTGRVDGASSNVQGPFCTSAATTLATDGRSTRYRSPTTFDPCSTRSVETSPRTV